MVVEDLDASDDDYLFNNFGLVESHPKEFDVFEQALQDLGIPLPIGFIDEIKQDQLENLGNKRKVWDATSQAEPPDKLKDVSWIGTSEKALAVDADGATVAVRYGADVVTVAEVLELLKDKHMGDDLPILMADFGCDYEAAAELVFSEKHQEAIHMLQQGSIASVAVNKAAAVERFKNLIFPLHDVWPFVHGCKDRELKEECGQIIRACGEFAEKFFPNEPFNDRIYAALERCKPLVGPFVSDSLKFRFKRALTEGKAFTTDASGDKESQAIAINRPRN